MTPPVAEATTGNNAAPLRLSDRLTLLARDARLVH